MGRASEEVEMKSSCGRRATSIAHLLAGTHGDLLTDESVPTPRAAWVLLRSLGAFLSEAR